MSDEQRVFDPVNDLDDMRSMNIQAAMTPGETVEQGLRQWATLPEESKPAVKVAWDRVQKQFSGNPGAAYVPTND